MHAHFDIAYTFCMFCLYLLSQLLSIWYFLVKKLNSKA